MSAYLFFCIVSVFFLDTFGCCICFFILLLLLVSLVIQNPDTDNRTFTKECFLAEKISLDATFRLIVGDEKLFFAAMDKSMNSIQFSV